MGCSYLNSILKSFLFLCLLTGQVYAKEVKPCAQKITFEVTKGSKDPENCYVLPGKFLHIKLQHADSFMGVSVEQKAEGKRQVPPPQTECTSEVVLPTQLKESGEYEYYSCKSKGRASFRMEVIPPHSDDVMPAAIKDYFVLHFYSCILTVNSGLDVCVQ